MKEKEFVEEKVADENKSALDNEQGYSMAYNITMVSAIATVAMFVIGTALYLTIVG